MASSTSTNVVALDTKREDRQSASSSFTSEVPSIMEEWSQFLSVYSRIGKEVAYTTDTTGGGATEMSDEWLKILIEKIDQDRRDSDTRIQESLNRIEHLMQRESDQMEATRKEIHEQNRAVNSRIDTAYTIFVGSSIATFVAVAALVLAVIFGILPLLKG